MRLMFTIMRKGGRKKSGSTALAKRKRRKTAAPTVVWAKGHRTSGMWWALSVTLTYDVPGKGTITETFRSWDIKAASRDTDCVFVRIDGKIYQICWQP
jgi:hypothetical protein